MADYDKQLKRILTDNNCNFVRAGKGSHQIWYSPITKDTFSVNRSIKSRHSANEILKDAGIKKMF
ncbi:MAG: type II toxin-antitoxin system HicA family toxin [Defluviitaleaceae bacterium]|nr:type II toxin-antitoxin system HicA family toxin [Defluviitaleaceae bacterium]MCL2273957.1 type II toxin-antitoxin system HicA family toxin [Defluviitaleaceae bacterium]